MLPPPPGAPGCCAGIGGPEAPDRRSVPRDCAGLRRSDRRRTRKDCVCRHEVFPAAAARASAPVSGCPAGQIAAVARPTACHRQGVLHQLHHIPRASSWTAAEPSCTFTEKRFSHRNLIAAGRWRSPGTAPSRLSWTWHCRLWCATAAWRSTGTGWCTPACSPCFNGCCSSTPMTCACTASLRRPWLTSPWSPTYTRCSSAQV
ncbi:unnamed protein product, partial [Ixodes pacificus]